MLVNAVLVLALASVGLGFAPSARSSRAVVSMEYIPDGFSKDQWQQLKKKEIEDLKAKGNLGALGTTKFKSRSFEVRARCLFFVSDL